MLGVKQEEQSKCGLKMFNIFSEFQPLTHVAIGNINSNQELIQTLPVLGDTHKNDLESLFNQTRQDFSIIQQALTYAGVTVEQSSTYNIGQEPAQSLPLAVRDWFFIYGEDVMIPHQHFAWHQMRSRSLDHVFNNSKKVTRWFGDAVPFNNDNTENIQTVFYDGANFLRCGKHIFYSQKVSPYGCKYGLESIKKLILDRRPDTNFVEVETDGHLDGALFLVRPGLLITSLKNLPDCFSSWDKIYVDYDTHKFTRQHEDLMYSKYHPLLVNKWHWYQQTNPQETAFSLNALSINENTVMFPGYDEKVFKQLEKYNIECINLNLKTCYFWDNGLHCFTNELHREGSIENYF